MSIVNYIWIGGAPLSHLGMINVMSWCLKGWTVNIYHDPCTEDEPQGIKRLIPEKHQAAFAELRVNVISLPAFFESIDETVDAFVKKLRKSNVPNWAYAVGDIGKALVAGYVPGIVLDLKIGPSASLDHDPPDVLSTKFVGMIRAGGTDVENQCMGSLDKTVPNAYGVHFLQSVKGYISLCGSTQIANGEAVFGWTTQTHAKLFRRVEGAVVNVAPYGAEFLEFLDVTKDTPPEDLLKLSSGALKGQSSSGTHMNKGPFRVFQRPGYYNWREGQIATSALFHQICVAYNLLKTFGNDTEDPLGALANDFWAKVQLTAANQPKIVVVPKVEPVKVMSPCQNSTPKPGCPGPGSSKVWRCPHCKKL